MENYLKLEVGNRGEILEVKWIENKTFEEIVEIGKKELEEYKEWLGDGCEEEFCGITIKEDVGIVEMEKDEDLSCGFYREDLVSELVGKDLNDKKNYELIEEVFQL